MDQLFQEKKEYSFGLKIAAVFFVIILIFSTILFLGASKYEAISYYGASLYRFLPFAAAELDGKNINLGEFHRNYKAVKKFYETSDFSSVDVEVSFEGDDGGYYDMNIRRKVLDTMINNLAAEKLLQEAYDLKVNKKRINEQFQTVLLDYGSAEQAENELKRLYGWDLNDFRANVAEPQMITEELKNKVLSDDSLEQNIIAKEKAHRALNRLKSGEDFELVAKEVSEGQSAAEGGELGFFKKGVMVQEFDDVAFNLNVGEVSDILRSQYGFHIIKLEERNQDEIRARHILFRTQTFEEWFQEKKYMMNVDIKVKGLKYDKDEGRVIFENDDYNRRLQSEEEQEITEAFEF